MDDEAITVDGGRLNVWHRRPAPGSATIVLIHGLTGTSRWWIPVMSHLPGDLGLIALDVRGRGRSWQSPPPFDLKTIADDVSRCLDHLELEHASVAGYSMGAWAAALFARRHPDRAERLVLVDGGLPIELDETLGPEEILEQVVGPAVARLSLEFDSSEAYLDFWREHPALARRWSPILDDVFAYEIHEVGDVWKVRANREAIIQGGSDFALDRETVAAAAGVQVPTTLLVVGHGVLDEPGGFTPLATARQVAEDNSNIELHLLERLNHYTLMLGDGAGAVASAIVA